MNQWLLIYLHIGLAWWRHQMETFSALLAIWVGNSPVPGEFPTQRPVTRSFDVFFDLRLNKRLGKQWWGWWFKTLSRPLWRHRNGDWTHIISYIFWIDIWENIVELYFLLIPNECKWTSIYKLLTHWGRDKMDAFFQATFSNGFSWMKMYEFRKIFHWSLFLGVQLAISQHWFR